MKRDIFVFAGQSNMMGAAVFPPKRELHINNSYEYKHKAKRLGRGDLFVKAGYPAGEFSYIDLKAAYAEDMTDENGNSKLADYINNTYFCPAMSNLKSEGTKELFTFSSFSESTALDGATLAPFLAEEWEKLGGSCAYAHIAKGGVSIDYYLTDKMIRENGLDIPQRNRISGAPEYFFEKCRDLFFDAEKRFLNDEISEKCFFWFQGESDANCVPSEYKRKLSIIWDELKKIGFTRLFCIRIDYFGADGISGVMRAQEDFVSCHADAYMLTRVASYLTYPGQNETDWFVTPPSAEYQNCRDSFFGYNNNHINEKGFSLIAERAAQNLYRVLRENKKPLLEEENIKALCRRREKCIT